jgi:molybdate transport system substrate-binding protein
MRMTSSFYPRYIRSAEGAMLSRRGVLAGMAVASALPASALAQQSADMGMTANHLKVLSAGSTLYGLRPAVAEFARTTGLAVDVTTDHGHNIHKAVLDGSADADIVLMPADWADEIVAAGRAAKDSLIDIGAVRIGAAIRDGAPRPDVASMAALRQALVAADAVLLTRAPTGEHLLKVIDRLGLRGAVEAKLQRFDTATLLNKHLAENASPGTLGFGPATEILVWRGKGVAYVGAIPAEAQVVLPYKAAMLTRSAASAVALRLLGYLATADARAHFRASGVE